MLVFFVGLPSRFAEWCHALARRIAERAHGAMVDVHANTLDDIASEAIRVGSVQLLVSSPQPSPPVISAIVAAARPFVLVLEDPRLAVHHLVKHRGSSFLDAVRAVACSCASVHDAREMAGALVLSRPRDGGERYAIAADIARHFGPDVADEELLEIVDELRGLPLDTDADLASQWWDSLDQDSLRVSRGALDGYISAFPSSGKISQLVWERELFFVGHGGSGAPIPAAEPIDITGRQRCLFYGPFVALPIGSWRASVALVLSPEAADMSYFVEAIAGSRLAAARLEEGAAVLSTVELQFAIDATLEQLVEIRIFSERAAFDGQLGIARVTLSRIDEAIVAH
jgi:hypothetical protein